MFFIWPSFAMHLQKCLIYCWALVKRLQVIVEFLNIVTHILVRPDSKQLSFSLSHPRPCSYQCWWLFGSYPTPLRLFLGQCIGTLMHAVPTRLQTPNYESFGLKEMPFCILLSRFKLFMMGLRSLLFKIMWWFCKCSSSKLLSQLCVSTPNAAAPINLSILYNLSFAISSSHCPSNR